MFPHIFGKYVLEREIAAGGMARVYLATLRGAVGFEKRLVVKQIRTELASDEAFVTRFVEEAKTAVELSHPNIVPVYELGVEQGVYYIAMELCEGLTLSEVLAETGPLGPAEGAYVGAEICRALDYAHRRAHIVHRDVTPRNVLIDDEGAVRLIDFGIAAPVTRATDTARTEVFGSPGHMPPEQLQGGELTPATDVFAVGALLIEAWTGSPPFRRASARASEHALGETPASVAGQVPELASLSALIASSVALDARDRPSAAELLARPLREFLKSEDSGDIARRLADRVRRARRVSNASAWPSGETGEGEIGVNTRPLHSEAPLTPSALAPRRGPITRTFAARDDLEIWTRQLPGGSEPRVTTLAAPDSGEPAARLPLPPAPLRKADRRSGVIPVLALSGCLVVLVFLVAPSARVATSRARAPLVRAPSLASTPPASSAVAPRLTTVAPSASVSAVTALVPLERHVPRQQLPRETASALASSAAPEQLGELKITADPRAELVVSGPHFQKWGQSPLLGLKLPPGKYQILFSNHTFGAPLNAEVVVVAGVSRSVHADFRQAEPTINVR